MLDLIATPFGYLLKFCYGFTQSYAVALILFTLLFKLILLPLSIKQQKAQVATARVKPIEKAIRKRYEGRTDQNAKVELSNDLMKMYKEEHVNAAGGCLPLLIQLPIIWILWEIIKNPLTYISRLSAETLGSIKTRMFDLIQSGVLGPHNTAQSLIDAAYKAGSAAAFAPTEIETVTVITENASLFSGLTDGITIPDFTLFGSIDLAQTPTLSLSVLILIPLGAALFQYLSTKVIQFFGPKPDTSTPEAAASAQSMKTMNIIFPFLTFFFALRLPAVIGLYWIYQSIFGMIIQVALYKAYPIPVFGEEEYARVEAEVNKDFVYVPVKSEAKRSLHHIDDDDDEDIEASEETGGTDRETVSDESSEAEAEAVMPKRRRYDKNGNKIRSLHYIDDEEDEEEVSGNAEEASGNNEEASGNNEEVAENYKDISGSAEGPSADDEEINEGKINETDTLPAQDTDIEDNGKEENDDEDKA